MPTWARRLVTRGIAIGPVVVITALYGSEGTAKLLVFSQVLLSMQLPFAVIPLVRFVTDREKMGRFVIAPWLASLAWVIASVIVVLNVKLRSEERRVGKECVSTFGSRGWPGLIKNK